ncbi:hypothetical protein ElyMa_006118200 [Elysia marginata]|uniref:Uncharacterized protein n=1 Tax=Elysia marginata TaxID=1093978 RepID=A0AAV4GTJ4_9GAST|nr:hypothetical protein ElyMa_006118200 [Elysia marginata]
MVQVTRCVLSQTLGKFKGQGMSHLERRRIIQPCHLTGHRFGNLPATMACIHTPETGGTVQDLFALVIGVIHAFRTREHSGLRLELAIRGEWHPESVQPGLAGIRTETHGNDSLLLFCPDSLRGIRAAWFLLFVSVSLSAGCTSHPATLTVRYFYQRLPPSQ